ncbi:MAG: hypothetical protein J7480_00155 [Microbacteriaceae bacterium]|nr:hypothetical protein [Microbacteriaceae bacterium]
MESVLGGGVLLAVAAALWLVYLVPNWLRRSEYLATERNAVRLQQTIRVLAETAETPEAVRLESLAKARAYEAQLRRRQAPAASPVAVGTPVRLADPNDPRTLAATRMRRTRIVTTVVIALAALVLLSQLVVALVGGIAAASGAVALAAGAVVGAGLWLQGRLAAAQRARSRAVARSAVVEGAPRPSRDPRAAVALPALAEPVDPRAWTPLPLPQPIHQVRREAALRVAAEADKAARAREAEERIVAARAAAATAPVAPAAPSRFAAMGVLEDLAPAAIDLDGALARRRAS